MRSLRRPLGRALLVGLAGLVVSGIAVAPATAAAAPSVGDPSPGSTPESLDWASVTFGDPWDFTQRQDATFGGGITVSGGIMTWQPSSAVSPNLVFSVASSQPWGRDGRRQPVDTARYPRLSLHLWSDRAASGGVSWTTCSWAVTSCRGFMSFPVKAGWHTYDLAIQGSGLSSAPAAWSGRVIGLRLTAASGPTFKLDWSRLHSGAPAVDVPWSDPSPGRSTTVYWDSDDDRTNNTADRPGWGLLASVKKSSSQNTTPFPAGAFPAGTYRFYVVAGGSASASSSPLTVVPRPRPVVHSPGQLGQADYATVVRKDPWDMAQRSDFGIRNARLLGMNGRWFTAENTSNDPYISLPMAGAFSGSTWRRVRIHVALDGPFSLSGSPGGGCVGRLYWTTASGGPSRWQTTDDLVLLPGWNDVVIDMVTSPSYKIVDPDLGANRIGWAGQTITQVRFDPNEDPGRRRWHVDDIRITQDPASSRGAFDIKFSDPAGVPGTTATVEAIDAKGAVRTIASGRAVQPGVNVVWWDPPLSVPAGSYRIRVKLTSSAGTNWQYGGAPLRMVPA
ncbi:MAG TPA: hypothetical protein VNU26_05630 [Mycobacteriales bacterium]|nr:hypothetical protein [Mycobacteriales bacterium]